MHDHARRGRFASLASTLGLIAVGGLLAPAARAEEAPPGPAGGKDDAAAAADRVKLDELLKKAVPLVEKARGHAFTAAVQASPMTREEFLDVQMRDLEKVLGGGAALRHTTRLLVHLGALPENADLKALLVEYMPSAVAAKYDPFRDSIHFLPGASRSLPTMVHEVTHALDDHVFDMTKQVDLFAGHFDRALAYGALAEGSAESVEYRFMFGDAFATAPLDNVRMQGEMMADAVLRRGGRTPPALVLAFKSQYLEGLLFVETLRRLPAGNLQLDRAFREPPDSTEQILHPDKFLDGEMPLEVVLAPPPEGVAVLTETTLGELGGAIVLMARGVEQAKARAAAAGWAGDRVALVAADGAESLYWTTWWDSDAEASEFEQTFRASLPAVSGGGTHRTVTAAGRRVDYFEGPVDTLPALVGWAKKVTVKEHPPKPRRETPPPGATGSPATGPGEPRK